LPVLPALEGLPAEVWHAHTLAGAPAQVLATGDALLDAQLPGGGWPVGALTEILQPTDVHSEWRLLLPALARSGQGSVALVGPPQVPFVPALHAQGLQVQRLLWVQAQTSASRLWATEQALRCAAVDAVLVWLPPARSGSVRSDQLRRLQMAASEYHKLLFVMRPEQALHDASPAVLRLLVGPHGGNQADALSVQVLKRRGPPLAHALTLLARGARMAVVLAASRSRDALDRTAAQV
jgi:protein ImuA